MAAGSEEGNAQLYVDHRVPMRSSSSDRTDVRLRPMEDRRVRVTTLDALAEAQGWQPPFGLKIDAEGHELDVVRGAGSIVSRADFVIAELSVADRFVDEPSFADFVGEMDAREMRLCDVLSISRSPDLEIVHMDAMFRRR